MSIQSINNIRQFDGQKLKNKTTNISSAQNALDTKSFSTEYSLGITNYALSSISFKGIRRKQLSDVPDMSTKKIKALANEIKKSEKQLVIISDYDGTFSGFVNNPSEAKPHGGVQYFNAMLQNFKKQNIPFVILTSRAVESLRMPGTLGPIINENKAFTGELNVIGLKGNDFLLSDNFNNNIRDFLLDKSQKMNGEIINTTIDGEKYSILTPTNGETTRVQEFTNQTIQKLENFGFKIENKKLLVNMHWRATEKSYQENPFKIRRVDGETYNEILEWKAQQQDFNNENYEKTDRTITIRDINNDNRKILVSWPELLGFAQHTFESSAKEIFKDDFSKGLKKMHLDEGAKVYELASTNIKNKGGSLEEIVELFGGSEKVFPIFIGDAIGKGQDDESAIQAANELGGIGIAIEKRSLEEIQQNPFNHNELSEHLSKTTFAKFKLDSFQDTTAFLNRLAREVSST